MHQIKPEDRKEILDDFVFEENVKNPQKFKDIVNHLADIYEGQDINAIGVLMRAAQKGKLDMYAEKLQKYYDSNAFAIPPNIRSKAAGQDPIILEMLLQKEKQILEGRRDPIDRTYLPKVCQELMKHPAAIELELFFLNCYKEMKIKPGQE